MLWNLATLAGAVAGNAIGDPRTYGLDAAVGAAFLALLWPRLGSRAQPAGRGRRRRGRARDVVPIVPAGVPVLAAAGVALLAGVLTKDDRPDDLGGGAGQRGVGCYLLKLAGLSVPPRVLERPLVERVADLIPVALLSALIAVQVFSQRPQLVLDARALGLGVAVVLLLLRAPFLVVVFGPRSWPRWSAAASERQVGPAPSPVRAPSRSPRGSAHADRAPGRGDRVVLRAARAVQVTGRVQRRRPSTGVVGARRHVDRQRAVPDLRGGGRGRCR